MILFLSFDLNIGCTSLIQCTYSVPLHHESHFITLFSANLYEHKEMLFEVNETTINLNSIEVNVYSRTTSPMTNIFTVESALKSPDVHYLENW